MTGFDKQHFKLDIDGTSIRCTTDDENLYLNFRGKDAHGRGNNIYMLLSYLLTNNGYEMKSNNVMPAQDGRGETLRLTPFLAHYWDPVKPENIVPEVEVALRQLKSAAEHVDPFIGHGYGFDQALQQIYMLNPKAPAETVPEQAAIRVRVPWQALRIAVGLGLVNAYVDHHTSNGAADLLPISRSIMNTLAFTQMGKDRQMRDAPSQLSEREIRQSIRTGLVAGLKAAGVQDVPAVEALAIKSVYEEIRHAKEILARNARSRE